MSSRPQLRLYRHPISGHCHRVELYCSLLGLPCELVHVDLMSGEHKQPDFLAKNPFGQVPVLEDGDFTLADSTAILLYLAERYDVDGRFWPRTPEGRGRVQRWLSVASGALVAGPAAARRVRLVGAKLDYEGAVRIAHDLFRVLERELTPRGFLVGSSPTLADLAWYAYVARAPEGDISLEPYPAIQSWLLRIEALPGFVPMQVTRKS